MQIRPFLTALPLLISVSMSAQTSWPGLFDASSDVRTSTFSFTGTSVSWIGCVKESIGRAKIYIDGALVEEVNMWRPVPIEGYQRTIFRADGLTNGPHTLTIEVVSSGSFVVVDAFDVHP